VPLVAPKFVPTIVTAVATAPLVGERLVRVGGTVTVNETPLLASPPTVTTTLPVVAPAGTGTKMLVADQLVGVAAVPLNVTVLVPLVAPKLVPAIVTAVATGPLVGVRLVMVGPGGAGTSYITSVEYVLSDDDVSYAWTAKKYRCPSVRLGTTRVVTLPTSITVV
jgi:hypothetical protein